MGNNKSVSYGINRANTRISFFAIVLMLCLFIFGCESWREFRFFENQIDNIDLQEIFNSSMVDAGQREGGNYSLNSSSNSSLNKVFVKRQLHPNTSWYWQLDEKLRLDYDVEMYDIDLFDVSAEDIALLHKRNVTVICYMSAGTAEDWRGDLLQFAEEIIGNSVEGWNGERWLDISNIDAVSEVMISRLDLATAKKCDGVEFDNIDGYLHDTGFDLSYDDQIAYNIELAKYAHARGLLAGLKNDVNQVDDLVEFFDFAVNEQCFEFDECEKLLPFIEDGKAVFGVEYNLELSKFCDKAEVYNFDWLKMDLELNGKRISCRYL